jgi:hypothetical protein
MDAMGQTAIQTYNGGIIFVSYLISVAGAQTTLELLTRRTHIRGYYNWYTIYIYKKTVYLKSSYSTTTKKKKKKIVFFYQQHHLQWVPLVSGLCISLEIIV